MRRLLYICLLRLHPAPFRRQFGDEMLAIFDDPASRVYSPGLFADAVVSLLRQWLVRPEFRKSSPYSSVPSGVPMFACFDDYRLWPGALLYGGVLSVLLLCALIFAIGRPGIASRWSIGAYRPSSALVPVTRSSVEGPEPDTLVTLAGHKDLWRELAALYFGQMPVLEALDANHDLTISASEIANAPMVLRQLDKNRDGKLSTEECGFFIGSPDSPKLDAKLIARIRRDFMHFHPVLAVLDSNHDGEISAEEMRNSFRSLRSLDINGDGSLSPPEVIPDQASAWAATILGTLDTNHDGQISAAERARYAAFNELIMSADRNHDGFTTMDELTTELQLRETGSGPDE